MFLAESITKAYAPRDKLQGALSIHHVLLFRYVDGESQSRRLCAVESERNGIPRSAKSRRSFCEWKGQALYVDVRVGDQIAENAGWYFPEPTEGLGAIKDHLAFYPEKMDRCLVDGELAKPQPGGFYGGWITADIIGPFKGEPGTEFW